MGNKQLGNADFAWLSKVVETLCGFSNRIREFSGKCRKMSKDIFEMS